MSIFAFIMLVAAIITLSIVTPVEISRRKTYGLGRKERKSLSRPSLMLVKEYRALPLNNRPYENILNIVKALDVKYGIKEVTSHFSRSGYEGGSVHTWNCRCYRAEVCPHKEYLYLHGGISKIAEAIADQQHALEVAGVEDGLSEVEELTNRLREEHEIIQQVTSALTQR